MRRLPDGPLVAWYGDDFTGASAVMEVLTFAGLPSVLFFEPPSATDRARFGDLRGIGIAGDARARPPEWMDEHLPPLFAALRDTGAPIVHYKVCSTLDSSPTIGSIGRAIDIALRDVWSPPKVPVLIGAPAIGRWQAFGNLFARAGDGVHRLDRHPTMSVHPVTPMHEADVTRHLAAQTARPVGLVDLLALKAGPDGASLAQADADIVAIDVIDEETLVAAGALVWRHAAQMFAVGSQGLEYALVAHFRAAGLLAAAPPPVVRPAPRVAVVSGSCSPVTADQISAAEAAGFAGIALDATAVLDPRRWDCERARAVYAHKSGRGCNGGASTSNVSVDGECVCGFLSRDSARAQRQRGGIGGGGHYRIEISHRNVGARQALCVASYRRECFWRNRVRNAHLPREFGIERARFLTDYVSPKNSEDLFHDEKISACQFRDFCHRRRHHQRKRNCGCLRVGASKRDSPSHARPHDESARHAHTDTTSDA
jgi:uncharacterized protein YgbK (DUF1537 family)